MTQSAWNPAAQINEPAKSWAEELLIGLANQPFKKKSSLMDFMLLFQARTLLLLLWLLRLIQL